VRLAGRNGGCGNAPRAAMPYPHYRTFAMGARFARVDKWNGGNRFPRRKTWENETDFND